MAAVRLMGRILSTSYRTLVTQYKPVRIVCNYRKTIPQLRNVGRQENNSDYSQGSNTKLLLSVLVGFSLFRKTEKTDAEQKEEKTVEHQEIIEDEVITVLKHAKLREMKQEFPEAEKFYHRALGLLAIYEQNNTWDKPRLLQARVYIYDSLANLALARGEIEKAEKLYKETLRGSLQQGMSRNHDAVVEISLKLAMIYAAQKKTVEANEGYKFCIKTQEEKIKKMKEVDDNSAALLGMAFDAYARFLMAQGQYKEARSSLERSLDIAQKVYGENNAQVAVLLNDIATVGSLMEDYDFAKENLERAVKVAENVDSPDLPTFYFNLGAIFERKGAITEARNFYKQAFTNAKKKEDKTVQKKANDALSNLKKIQS